MQNEVAENLSGTNDPGAVVNSTPPENETPPLETQQRPTTPPVEEDPDDSPETSDDEPDKDQAEATAARPEDRVHQYADRSQVGIMSAITGACATANFMSITHQHGVTGEKQQSLDVFVRVAELYSPGRTYKSLDVSSVVRHSGCLQTERILLLSCHDEQVALTVAKSIAYATNIASKELVNIDENGQGHYNFRHLIDSLARPKEKRKASPNTPKAICVWDATAASEDEIASGILDSLLSANSRIEQYQQWLSERGLSLICLVSPQRVQRYNDSHFASLRSLQIDFLSPLLEHYVQDQYETLAATIRQQRQEGRWSEDDAEFYEQISRHLRNGNLSETVQNRATEVPHAMNVEDLFSRQDPISDAILYCATYFPNLSPQDLSYLVELFIGEATEEVAKRVSRREQPSESELVVESVPLVNRWRRDADTLLRQCKLAVVKNEDDKRVIDFPTDGLRHRLSKHIRNERPFFYESNFTIVRQQGLLFSPKKVIAEGARQLLVETAKYYMPNDVANWLYEIVHEFEEMAQAADRLQELTPQFQLLPDLRVKAARRYISYGLSRVLIRLDKSDELREAVRLFWQKLLQTQHQWFLDLLRRMGDSTPAESLKWLKQLLDQGTEVIRRQARVYLVVYLLHRDSSIYSTLKELMEWPKSTQAGRIAREVLIVYCAETNRQVAQQDYGRWPSLHPLFGFKSRSEAEECLDLLIGWVWAAASEVDPDKALFLIADLFAGWFFILSPTASEDSSEVSDEVDGESGLSARIVTELLFKCLAGHFTQNQSKALMEIWERLKNDILDRVIELDTIMNEIANSSLDLDITDAGATARHKLMDIRASLTELREAFITSTEAVAATAA